MTKVKMKGCNCTVDYHTIKKDICAYGFSQFFVRGLYCFKTFAGFPPTIVYGGTFLVTTDPPAIIECFPIVTPATTTELAPIQQF